MLLQLYTFSQLGGYLPLITFALGIILTFTVTSVNHRRIHRDDIRKTIFEAVLNTKNCASDYWLSPYDETRRSDFISSIVLFQHLMPLSESMMNKNQQLEMQDILERFFIALRGIALKGEDDVNQKYHKINPEQVARIHTIGSFFLKQYYSIYLEQTRMRNLTIYPPKVQNLWIWLKSPDKNPQFKNGGA